MTDKAQNTNIEKNTNKENKEELIIVEDNKQIIKKEETNLVKAEATEFDALIKIAEAYDKLKPFADNYIKNNPNSGLKTAEDVFTTMVLGRELGLNPEIVNVNGGAIALGHPLGCTGAKLSVQLFDEMRLRNSKYGIVSMCVGTGQGAAGIFEFLK